MGVHFWGCISLTIGFFYNVVKKHLRTRDLNCQDKMANLSSLYILFWQLVMTSMD